MSRTPASLPLLCACAVLLGSPWIARGDDEADDVHARASRLNQNGAAAYKDSRWNDALAKFEAAYRLFPAPAVMLNLSRTELKLGRCNDAVTFARTYLATLTQGDPKGAGAAGEWLTTVESECPAVEIETDPPDGSIRIEGLDGMEGEASPRTPWRGRLRVGKHDVRIFHPGYAMKRMLVEVAAGAPVHLHLTLIPESGPAAPPPVAPALVAPPPAVASARSPPGDLPLDLIQPPVPPAVAATTNAERRQASAGTWRAVGWAGVVAGGLGLIAAVALGATVNTQTTALGKAAPDRTGNQAQAQLNLLRTWSVTANVLYGVGGGVAVTGAVLVIVF